MEWAERITSLLSDETRSLGVVLAACTLILGVIDKDPRIFAPAVPQVRRPDPRSPATYGPVHPPSPLSPPVSERPLPLYPRVCTYFVCACVP
jgi:hypothetical protein